MSNSGKPALGLVVYLVLPTDILGNLCIAVSEAIKGVRKGISWAATRPRGHGLCQKESDERRYIRDHKESREATTVEQERKAAMTLLGAESLRRRGESSNKETNGESPQIPMRHIPARTVSRLLPHHRQSLEEIIFKAPKCMIDTVDPMNCVSQFAMLVLTGGKVCSAVR